MKTYCKEILLRLQNRFLNLALVLKKSNCVFVRSIRLMAIKFHLLCMFLNWGKNEEKEYLLEYANSFDDLCVLTELPTCVHLSKQLKLTQFSVYPVSRQ